MTRTARIGLRDGDTLTINGTRITFRFPRGKGRGKAYAVVHSDKKPSRQRAAVDTAQPVEHNSAS